jgi:hypothetical protein
LFLRQILCVGCCGLRLGFWFVEQNFHATIFCAALFVDIGCGGPAVAVAHGTDSIGIQSALFYEVAQDTAGARF